MMEDLITTFELVDTRLLRICPIGAERQDKKYELSEEQAVLGEQCPKCGLHFPFMTEKPSSFAVFKDVPTSKKETPEDGAAPDPDPAIPA